MSIANVLLIVIAVGLIVLSIHERKFRKESSQRYNENLESIARYLNGIENEIEKQKVDYDEVTIDFYGNHPQERFGDLEDIKDSPDGEKLIVQTKDTKFVFKHEDIFAIGLYESGIVDNAIKEIEKNDWW